MPTLPSVGFIGLGQMGLLDRGSSDPVPTSESPARLAALRADFVDAPVSGGVKRAVDGSLSILLEAPYCSPGRRSPYLDHPEVHGGRLGAAWVGSLLSPCSPQALRDRATWIYSQAGPGIYDGDLAFYSDDFDAHAHTAHIDTARTPLWLLTGDYDYSATPADSARVAHEVPGAQFEALPGYGHFPMVKNPDGLLPHLLAPLDALWVHRQETLRCA